MQNELNLKKCIPCITETPPLQADHLQALFIQLQEGWEIVAQHHLEKEYTFKNFKEALIFTNAIGGIAEEEGHHPDIELSWGRVKLTLFTHKINGLSESDFILAVKLDRCFENFIHKYK